MIAAPNARACAANWPKYAGVACGNTMRCPDMLARPTFGSTASGLPASRMSAIAPSAAAGPAPWFAPKAATSSAPSRAAAARAETPASVCRSLSNVMSATIGSADTERTPATALSRSTRS